MLMLSLMIDLSFNEDI